MSLLPAKQTQSLIVCSENNPVRGRVGKQAVEDRLCVPHVKTCISSLLKYGKIDLPRI